MYFESATIKKTIDKTIDKNDECTRNKKDKNDKGKKWNWQTRSINLSETGSKNDKN